MPSSAQPLEKVWHLLRHPREIGPLFRSYLGIGRRRLVTPIEQPADLAHFLESRANFVTQMSLYTYLRTRAGQRYPQLFDDPAFSRSINFAKWQIWLACLGDISIYAGGLLAQKQPDAPGQVGRFIVGLVEEILSRNASPADSGPDFAAGCEALRSRLAACEWHTIPDDPSVFTESPPAVIKWAPIVDHLKALDEPIVINSVRFRWQEVRRDLRQSLRHEALATAMGRTGFPPAAT